MAKRGSGRRSMAGCLLGVLASLLFCNLSLAGVQQITDTPWSEGGVRASGDWLVYIATNGGGDWPDNEEIYIHQLSTGVATRLTDDAVRQWQPAIAGDLVVWADYRYAGAGWDLDVFGYDISMDWLGPVAMEPAAQYQPTTNGQRVVWVDNREDISLYKLYAAETPTGAHSPVSIGPAGQWKPELSGDRVVWQDQRDDDGDIYLYDFSTSTLLPICTAAGTQWAPDIDGDIVVWTDERSGKATIWFYDLATSETEIVCEQTAPQYDPRVSGTRVVWHASGGIFLCDLNSPGLRALNEVGGAVNPDIDGDTIVWSQYIDGSADIYMYVNSPPQLDPIGDKAVLEGETLLFIISASDPEEDPLAFSAFDLPAGAVFDPDTQVFTWTPTYGQAGVYAGVTFSVSDGELSDSEAITITVTEPPPVEVDIDIKPGSDRNPVNPKSEGVLPVAVFTTEEFDATDIDPSTVLLAGAPLAQNPDDGGWMIHEEDVNEDGLLDAMLQFETEEMDVELLVDGEYAVLTGSTFEGMDFVGWDNVTIVPKDLANDHWALEAIAGCIEGGIVAGYPDGLYHPEVLVTRDQMAVYISRAMAGGQSNVPEGPEGATFPDVPTDHWAYDCIEYAVAHEVVTGYADGRYHPGWGVTRSQMPVFIARGKGWVSLEDDMSTAPELFLDVPAGYWSGTAIEACVGNDVVQGYRDGLYRPATYVTRDQMAVYVARAFEPDM